MIYIIGDSHVSVFSGLGNINENGIHIQPEFGTCYTLSQGQLRPVINKFEQNIPYFCAIKVGSYTAYNSYNKLPKIEQAIAEYNISCNDFIFLCFGEIDIRIHIGPQAEKQNIPLDKAIENCVDNYMKTILYLKSKYCNVCVYAPIASTNGWDPDDYGDVNIRNEMTLHFNKYLIDQCKKNNIIVKSITDKLILPDGTTDESFYMDAIHLSQKCMPLIQSEFEDIISKF
jgi:hypothetical protein